MKKHLWSMSFSDQRSTDSGVAMGIVVLEAENLTDAARKAFHTEGVDKDWIVYPHMIDNLDVAEAKLPRGQFINTSKLEKMKEYVVVRT